MNRQLPKPSNNNQYIRRKSRSTTVNVPLGVQAGQPGNTQQPPNSKKNSYFNCNLR